MTDKRCIKCGVILTKENSYSRSAMRFKPHSYCKAHDDELRIRHHNKHRNKLRRQMKARYVGMKFLDRLLVRERKTQLVFKSPITIDSGEGHLLSVHDLSLFGLSRSTLRYFRAYHVLPDGTRRTRLLTPEELAGTVIVNIDFNMRRIQQYGYMPPVGNCSTSGQSDARRCDECTGKLRPSTKYAPMYGPEYHISSGEIRCDKNGCAVCTECGLITMEG
jgi:hypothetical protein